MSRLMSVAMTTDAVVERRKTVTRRKGWWVDKHGRRILHPGDRLTLCRKVQGRKPGEPIERLAEVEVIDVRRESLCLLSSLHRRDDAYAHAEVAAEGFPDLEPDEFAYRYFIEAQRMSLLDVVTRIEWRYLACDECGYGTTCWPGPLTTVDCVTRCYVCQHEHECSDDACAWCGSLAGREEQ